MDNALETWLDHHGCKYTPNAASNRFTSSANRFTKYIMNKGHEFEDIVIRLIQDRLQSPDDMYRFDSFSEGMSSAERSREIGKRAKSTLALMHAGRPIIYQGVVRSTELGAEGLPDLIVKGSHFDVITDNPPEDIDDNDYYIVDIKYSSLALSTKSDTVYTTASTPAYKMQVAVYTLCLNEMLNQDVDKAFLLGRRTVRSTDSKESYGSCFDRLGLIDFGGKDSHYLDDAVDGIEWYRDMVENGSNWKIDPPDIDEHPELLPNTDASSGGRWAKVIRDLAEKNADLSQIWGIGPKKREYAVSNGLSDWKDPDVTAESLGLSGKTAVTVDQILATNRADKATVFPPVLYGNVKGWQDSEETAETLDFTIDFETTSSAFDSLADMPRARNDSYIFAIGIGYIDNGKWMYRSLLANELSSAEETRLVSDMMQIIKEKCSSSQVNVKENPPRVYHWGCAEMTWMRRAIQNMDRPKQREFRRIFSNMIDMSDIVQQMAVTVKGALNYKLKSFTTALEKHGMREFVKGRLKKSPYDKMRSIWEDTGGIGDGLSAMHYCWEVYNHGQDIKQIHEAIRPVVVYNELDCFSVYAIREFLRGRYGYQRDAGDTIVALIDGI